MFGFGKKSVNYKEIFSDRATTHKFLYDDRSKTSTIFADKKFVDAWLSSAMQAQITAVIKNEADKGDIPSIKQMIWFLNIIHEEKLYARISEKDKAKILIKLNEDRIKFCDKLAEVADESRPYDAMFACHHLYEQLRRTGEEYYMKKQRDVLNKLLTYADEVVSMGDDNSAFDGDKGFIQDAQKMIEDYSSKRDLLDSFISGLARIEISSLEDLSRYISEGGDEALKSLPKLAEDGNVFCQKFLAQWSAEIMQSSESPRMSEIAQHDFVRYSTLAAESGDSEEQFNIAVHYFKLFDASQDDVYQEDIDNFRLAAYWMRKSADAGFEPALHAVDDYETVANMDVEELDKSN